MTSQPPSNLKGSQYCYLPTADAATKILCVFVSRDVYEYAERPLPAAPGRAATLLRDTPHKWRDEKLLRLHGDWVFLEDTTSRDPGQPMSFTWAAPLTPEQLASPVPFHASWDNEQVEWPAVLERRPSGAMIDFSPDGNFPFYKELDSSSVTTDRILANWSLRPAWPGLTEVLTSEYLSPVPWGPVTLEVIEPTPQVVRWNQTPTSEDLGECLHDEVIIPAFGTTQTLASGITTTTPPATPGEILPATNYIDWQDRVISIRQTYEGGLYHIVHKWAKAPPRDDLTRRLL